VARDNPVAERVAVGAEHADIEVAHQPDRSVLGAHSAPLARCLARQARRRRRRPRWRGRLVLRQSAAADASNDLQSGWFLRRAGLHDGLDCRRATPCEHPSRGRATAGSVFRWRAPRICYTLRAPRSPASAWPSSTPHANADPSLMTHPTRPRRIAASPTSRQFALATRPDSMLTGRFSDRACLPSVGRSFGVSTSVDCLGVSHVVRR
jgi:hypothetical protein